MGRKKTLPPRPTTLDLQFPDANPPRDAEPDAAPTGQAIWQYTPPDDAAKQAIQEAVSKQQGQAYTTFPVNLNPWRYEYASDWSLEADWAGHANTMGEKGWELVAVVEKPRQMTGVNGPGWYKGYVSFWKRLKA